MTYIHYGSPAFDLSKFEQVRNYFNKPQGGLWASPVDAEYGWKNWCEEESFRECHEENSFSFRLAENANVLRIDSVDKESTIPRLPGYNTASIHAYDFEKLVMDGIDAVEFVISLDRRLYWAMYGWDCDSILVLNPAVVVPIGTDTHN